MGQSIIRNADKQPGRGSRERAVRTVQGKAEGCEMTVDVLTQLEACDVALL